MKNKVTLTEKEALELAIDKVDRLYDPWYMEMVRGDEWVCILLDGTVALAGEYQDMNVDDDEDAAKFLFKFQVGELVEQHFEFKRKSNLSKS